MDGRLKEKMIQLLQEHELDESMGVGDLAMLFMKVLDCILEVHPDLISEVDRDHLVDVTSVG